MSKVDVGFSKKREIDVRDVMLSYFLFAGKLRSNHKVLKLCKATEVTAILA
jgi:hypothetical protein